MSVRLVLVFLIDRLGFRTCFGVFKGGEDVAQGKFGKQGEEKDRGAGKG